MWDTNTNNKLQIGANIAILLGLVMVAYQIQQANTISSAEFLDTAIVTDNNRQFSLLGEMPNESMIRVLYKPEEATIDDYFIADRIYESIFAQLNRTLSLDDIGLSLGPVFGVLRANSHFFSCPYGIAYLDNYISQQGPANNRNSAFQESIEQLRELAGSNSALELMQQRIQITDTIISSGIQSNN